MAQLAIKGHPTRGKEVIQLLEMLGGENNYYAQGNCTEMLYFIYDNKGIKCLMESDVGTDLMKVYTLEEFEKLYPYKVGDKVTNEYELPMMIFDIYWDSDFNTIKYNGRFLENDKIVRTGLTAEDLQPYKEEETMEEPKELIIGFTKDDNGDWVLNTHKDYEIKEIEGKFKVIKKKPTYPKTYEECCEVIGYRLLGTMIIGYKAVVLRTFQKLLVCRDAYWKIAGDWKPDWTNGHVEKYYIYLKQNEINKSSCFFDRHFLTFPTKEMRDAFYENFKELIEQCKELL